MRNAHRWTWMVVAGALAALGASMPGCSGKAEPSARPGPAAVAPRGAQPLAYPRARMVDHVDVYHGVKVADPYRWLEDADSEETAAWIAAQQAITQPWLESIPARSRIQARLTELWNYERYGLPTREGGRYFFTRNDGLQNQAVLYVADALDAESRVLIDPNTFSEDGTISLANWSPSPDGRLLAYAISDGGSDWRTWRVRDVETGEDLDDLIEWSKFSGAAWAKDSSGFYYSRYAAPEPGQELVASNDNQQIFFHRIGDAQDRDELIYARPDQPRWGLNAWVTDDGRFLIVYARMGTDRRNGLYYRDLTTGSTEFTELVTPGEASFSVFGSYGTNLFIQTDLDAPLGRIISVDTRNPARGAWRELVPESRDTLRSSSHVGGRFVLQYLQDAKASVRVHSTDGRRLREMRLPGIGSVGGFGGKPDDTETFYTFTSFTSPGTIFRHDLETGESTVFREPQVAFDPRDYVTNQVFYRSKDGTRVPMFITHKRGIPLDHNRPTLLYGYGGFMIPVTPSFSPANLAWMEMGGIYVVANIRGGSEYGSGWHRQGSLLNKQNTFDDFIAAAEDLIRRGYTQPSRLGIFGGSNGGLLVAACMIQRPDLFGAVIPAVGVLDMLRFDRFTIGWAWRSDYGHPEENEADFLYNLAYSPYHNIEPGRCYPATLITTADRDDRVVPMHSFKFGAALQAAQGCANPILMRIETRAGHGAGTPTSKLIEAAADRWAFLYRALGMEQDEAHSH